MEWKWEGRRLAKSGMKMLDVVGSSDGWFWIDMMAMMFGRLADWSMVDGR